MAPGDVQLAISVRGAAGEIIDRETRTLRVPAYRDQSLALSTPVLCRAITPAEVRAALTADEAPVHAGRTFARTDRLIVRLAAHGTSAGGRL